MYYSVCKYTHTHIYVLQYGVHHQMFASSSLIVCIALNVGDALTGSVIVRLLGRDYNYMPIHVVKEGGRKRDVAQWGGKMLSHAGF